MKGMTKKSITLIISLLLVGHVLLFYALPFNVFVLVFIVFTILFLFIEWQNAIMISVSLAITTFVLNIALNLSGISEEIYYRPHEMFGLDHPDGRYKQNIHFEMTMPHGDLKALSLYTKITPEPRNVIFQTDSLGYRNSKEYSGQKYLLVGDSFIVGNGTTQQDIITNQLFKKYGIDTYNLAYPGGVKEYANFVKSFKKSTNTKPKVILFLFEGNDFTLNKQRVSTSSYIIEKLKRYYTKFNDTGIYRFTYSSTQRILATKIYRGKERVEVRNIGGIPVAFYKEYIAITEQNILPNNLEVENYIATMNNDISHIYFIPTKYRVYYNHLNHERHKVPDLPNKQWELVQLIGTKFNIPTTNLTPALVEESDRLLKDGVLTYWRDDTHWNKHGISVAAEIVKNSLVSHN